MPSRLEKVKAAIDELERQVGGATDRAERRGRQAVNRTRRGARRAIKRTRRGTDETVDRVESPGRTIPPDERVQERVETDADPADQPFYDRDGDSGSSESSLSPGAQRLRAKAKEKARKRGKFPPEYLSEESSSETSAGSDSGSETSAGSDSGGGRAERVREAIERQRATAESVGTRVKNAGRRRAEQLREATAAPRDDSSQLADDIKAADEIAGAFSTGATRAAASERPPDGSSEPSLDAAPRTERGGRDDPEQPLGADVGLESEEADQLAADIAAQDDRIDESDIAGFERVDPDPRRSEALPRDPEPVFRAELTDEARRDIARDQIAEQNPEIDAGDIQRLEPTDDGAYQAVLTDEARRELAGAPERSDPTEDFDPPDFPGPGEFIDAVGDEGFSTVQRGGTASEVARDTAAVGLAVGLENPDEVDAIAVEERTGTIDVTSPSVEAVGFDTPGALPVEFQSDDRGQIDPDVASSVTPETGGFLSDEQRAETAESLEQRREAIVGSAEGESGSVASARRGVADAASIPREALLAADTAASVGDDLPEAVGERGLTRTAVSGSAVAGPALERGVNRVQENPGDVAVRLVTGGVVASAGVRGAAKGRQRIADARTRRRADAEVDLEDLTTEQAVETGDLPEFETSTDAPTDQAVGEVRRRAADQPEQLQSEAGESVLLRSENERLPADLKVSSGQSELPGLFASPELSPLRLEERASRTLPKPRLPRLGDFSPDRQRTSAFPGDRIEGAPRSAAGSGFAVRGPGGEIQARFGAGGGAARAFADEIGGQRVPDPDTAGAQFLKNEAAEGTAYVRPTGDRTSELEALFPPGSEFQRQSQLAVNLPDGEVTTLDVYRRSGRSVDADSRAPLGDRGADAERGEPITAVEISRRDRRGTRTSPEGEPVAPAPPTAGGFSSATTAEPPTLATLSSGGPPLATDSSPLSEPIPGSSSTGSPSGSSTGSPGSFSGSSGQGSGSSGAGGGSSTGSPGGATGTPPGTPPGLPGIPPGSPGGPGGPGRIRFELPEPDPDDEPIPLFDDVETPFVNPIVSGLEESFDSVLGAGETNTLDDVFAEVEGQGGDPLAGDPLEDL